MYGCEVKLTGENAVIEDVERDESLRIGGGGDEAGVIVDAEVVLEPQDRRSSSITWFSFVVGLCDFGSERKASETWSWRGKEASVWEKRK